MSYTRQANGRVITGFEQPFYFKKSQATAKELARGVDVSIAVESTDNLIFYADNGEAENIPGDFKSGTLTLNVDGLFDDAANDIFGRTAPDAPTGTETAGWQAYTKGKDIPTVAIGFVVRYISHGQKLYVPFILPRCQFKPEATTAKTQGESIEFQTQSLEAKISTIAENNIVGCSKGDWKYTGMPYDSATSKYLDGYEQLSDAVNALKAKIATVFTEQT